MSCDFQELGVIGRGAFGEAMLVQATGSGKQYVMKQISLLGLNSDQAENIFAEADALQLLDHPNIVKCHRCWINATAKSTDAHAAHKEQLISLPLRSSLLKWPGSHDNSAYAIPKSLHMLLELADGGSLDRVISNCHTHMEEFLLGIWIAQMLLGLLHMHETQLIHRDLKPANIFVTRTGIIKIGDLGGSQHIRDLSEECSSQYGSPLYMCPEVWSRGQCSAKSDIWSLGCVAYELLQLFPPFQMPCLTERVLHAQPLPLPTTYSLKLRGLIMSMLHKDPAKRPTTHQLVENAYISNCIRDWVLLSTSQHSSDQLGMNHNMNSANKMVPGREKMQHYMHDMCKMSWQTEY
mmetsp:Transcript_6548/g.12891  ORF Transcript_6548/g.12891 Transcript_6548/m.12891 type:complete len:350 (-) Transcript_6548:174-1223(-)